MFHFQGMFSHIMKALMSGFCFVCLLVWSFSKNCICHWCLHPSFFLFLSFSFFLSLLLLPFFPRTFSSSISPLRAEGFVVHFLLSGPSFKMQGFFLSDRHRSKEMRNDLHSLAPLHFRLPYYYQTHAPLVLARTHTHTQTHTRARPRAHPHPHHLPHALSQMISEVSSEKRHPNL